MAENEDYSARMGIGLGVGLFAALIGALTFGVAGIGGNDPATAAAVGTVEVEQTATPEPSVTPSETDLETSNPDPDRVSDHAPSAPAQTPERDVYPIEDGDTLAGISREVGVSVDKLAVANGILNVNLIYRGSSIVIPTS